MRTSRSRLFCLVVGVAGLATTALALHPRPAFAQVSDQDRAAARDLYFEGVKLQDAAKFAEALDRFDRAQRIFSAPTHLLHIAECQASLGRLVEAAESYRALIRTPLPSGSPQAFQLAQQQAVAELPGVEPRIPQVKIDVTPVNAANLQVQVDGAVMNTALVGVSRRIDPGTHKLVVFAPGYGKQEQTFAVKERESKVIAITLVATSGVVYGPAVAPVPGPVPQPVPAGTAVAPPPPIPPPADAPASDQWKTQKKGNSMGLLFGVRGGGLFPLGSAYGDPRATTTILDSSNNTKFSDLAGAGGAFGLEGGFRFATHFMGGIAFEHGFFGKGDNPILTSGPNSDSQQTLSSNYFSGNIAYISNPEGFGFYGELGIGYRWFKTSAVNGAVEQSLTLKGAEFEFGAGAWIRAGDIRIVPKITFSAGSFTQGDSTCTGATCSLTAATSSAITNTAIHTFIFLGVGGYYNIDFGK